VLLRVTPTSPFGRKVRMAISHLGLSARIEMVKADPMDPADALRRDNPLGKIPTLITDDGEPVFDSRVILEYLDHIAGGGKLIPAAWPQRIETLTLQAMCDGAEALHHKPWLDYQRGKVVRGLAAFAKETPDAARFDVGTLTAACMLGYLDWRKQVDWRPEFPALVGWLDQFRARHPEFDATTAPV
jgi:glutathione S-transferase